MWLIWANLHWSLGLNELKANIYLFVKQLSTYFTCFINLQFHLNLYLFFSCCWQMLSWLHEKVNCSTRSLIWQLNDYFNKVKVSTSSLHNVPLFNVLSFSLLSNPFSSLLAPLILLLCCYCHSPTHSSTFPQFSAVFYSPLPSITPFCVLSPKRAGFPKEMDIVSLCKCHFVSSDGGGRKQRGKVRGEEFMLRDATPYFALLGWEEMEDYLHRDRNRRRQRGLMVSDVLGDSSKICLSACGLRGNTHEER